MLITSHCNAVVASDIDHDIEWDDFEQKLRKLINSMHLRGVAHCDLRSPGNVLMDSDNNPYIIDFVSSIFKSNYNPIWNLLFSYAKKADYSAILKIKSRIKPALLSMHEIKQLKNDAKKGNLFRWITGKLRILSQSVFGIGK